MEFPGVLANDDVSLDIRKGEVFALVGENGAGKTTLMNILYGIHEPTNGEVYIRGRKVERFSPKTAISMGVGMVHQHFMLVPSFTVAQNIVMSREPRRLGVLFDNKAAEAAAQKLVEEYGLVVDPAAVVREIGVGLQQRVEILKTLYRGADILILDEPTAVLTPQETDELFAVIRRVVRELGMTVIIITHKLYEVMAISDRVGVMRKGRLIGVENTCDVDEKKLASMMVGRPVLYDRLEKTGEAGAEQIRVSGLIVCDDRGLVAVDGLSLSVRAGEVLGVAGLVGSRRTELLSTIFGIMARESGEIKLNGKPISNKTPRQSIKNGFAMLTEERRATGIFPYANILFNTVISNLGSYKKGPLLSDKKMASDTDWSISSMHIKTPSQKTLIKNLSGGNQQKVILGRWLLTDPDVLLLDEPTRGIDVGAKYEIYELILQLAREGKAVMMVSSEMPELIGICDRILVMSNGHMAGILERGKDFGGVENEQETIMRLAAQYV